MYRVVFLLFLTSLPLSALSSTITPNVILNADSAQSQETAKTEDAKTEESTDASEETETIAPEDTPCTCGVFLSSQFKKGSKEQPKGTPALTQEIDTPFMNNAFGNKQCTHRCLEMIIKHLPKSSDIICATVDKEIVNREKAFLFVKNRSDKWHTTNFNSGREFCCKDYLPAKCSQMKK